MQALSPEQAERIRDYKRGTALSLEPLDDNHALVVLDGDAVGHYHTTDGVVVIDKNNHAGYVTI